MKCDYKNLLLLAWTGFVMYLLNNSIIESFLSSDRQSRLHMPGFTLRRVVCGAPIFNYVLELGIMFFIVKVLVYWSGVYKWKKTKTDGGWELLAFVFLLFLFDNYSLLWCFSVFLISRVIFFWCYLGFLRSFLFSLRTK